jgi:pimeloyl-ACP methyl ester carboxylesterase
VKVKLIPSEDVLVGNSGPDQGRRRVERTVAIAVGATLVATVLTVSPPADAGDDAAAAAPAIAWGRCSDARLRSAGAQCGMLAVPLNHADPSGRTIRIAVSRIKATAPASARQGPLLINPGGPGGEGLRMSATLYRDLPRSVATAYDLVGFDPRGVGASRPRLTCKSGYAKGPRPGYRPVTGRQKAPGENERRWLKRSRKYANACASKSGDLLPFLRTEDVARDMDLLRRALGARRINYYGFSYGTYLGQVYASMFPNRTRRLVFDGVVDPRNVWYAGQLAQDRAFEKAMKKFFGWVASHHATYGLGSSAGAVERRYYRDEQRLRRHPVGQIGSAEWNDVFLTAGYSQYTWTAIARAWSAWKRGSHGAIRARYTSDTRDFDNGYGIYLAVQCTDVAWPKGYATWRRDAFATVKKARFETWSNVWFNAPCLYWQAPSGTPVRIDGSRTPSLLLVSSTLDGATPFRGARQVRRLFPHSALVAQVGSTTHSDSLNGNRCVDAVVIRYLRSGSLPARDGGTGADVRCRRSPLPRP